ncbi:MAG TPA: thiamine pyrophosphate-dependent enzyme [Syntrophorhabdaceae bacterium]|nr:thiamine pyrophosphate-dependent enzyme [Syntrophorhabdaceae bacterium]
MERKKEVMIGNYAIARGLVEAGIDLAAAYPGTPSSEILPGIIEFNKREKGSTYAEWSVNERCALEVAIGAAMIGKKSACMMKQVGLNVAFPPLPSFDELKIRGGLVMVVCDDPGPQSSQTEQDTRLISVLMDIAYFEPSSPDEAADIAYYAMNYSYEHKLPVIIRSTHRVSHARQAVSIFPKGKRIVDLKEGVLNKTNGNLEGSKLGIVSSGMTYSTTLDVLKEMGLDNIIPVFKVTSIMKGKISGDKNKGIIEFVDKVEHVLVLEETDAVLELLIGKNGKVLGRNTGHVPSAGELTYNVIRDILGDVLESLKITKKKFFYDYEIEDATKEIHIVQRPPKLCAGCPHRATFYAMKEVFPEAVFPGDIGCYTLGTSLGAVDTCIDMGGGINIASGFYDAYNQDGALIPIIATIGDSTFFHAGITPLYDAVKKNKRFMLIIMDNGTTAMTGMQPTPQTGITAQGELNKPILIEDMVSSLGIDFLKVVDPYDVPLMINTIKDAYNFLSLEIKKAAPAVIIARRECVLSSRGKEKPKYEEIPLEKTCIGCRTCIDYFGCPAIQFDDDKNQVIIDEGLCTKCGVCLFVCPMI